MGPKKAKKDTGVDQDADKVELLNNKVQTLQKQLVDQQQIGDANRAAENQIRQRVMYLERDLKAEKQKKMTIMTAMTHQYKQMQKEYQDELDELTATINIRSTELQKNNENINETRKQQDIKLKAKETEIKQLKGKIEDMSSEFAKMLKETLDKMQQRINLAQWDNDSDPQMIKKIKEMNNM